MADSKNSKEVKEVETAKLDTTKDNSHDISWLFAQSTYGIREGLYYAEQESSKSALISGGEIWRYFLFALFFFVIIFLQLEVEGGYQITAGVDQALRIKKHPFGLGFEDIYNVTHATDFLKYGFQREILQEKIYDIITKGEADRFRLGQFNKVITALRIVQERVEIKDNHSQRFDEFILKIWPKISGPHDREFEQSTDDFSSFDMFAHNSDGFTIWLTQPDIVKVNYMIELLVERRWMDIQTKNMKWDFVLYNGNYQMMCYVVFIFDVLPSGWVTKEFDVETYRITLYYRWEDYIRLTLELIYVVLIVWYSVIFVVSIVQTIRGVNLREEQKEQNDVEKAAGYMKDRAKQIWKGITSFFSDVFNIIDLVQLTTAYMLIFTWLAYTQEPFLVDYIKDPDSFDDSAILRGMSNVQYIYRFYRRVVAVNALFMAIRFLKYAGKIKRVAVIVDSLRNAWGEIVSFIVYLCAFLFAFSAFAYISYGRYFEQFSTLQQSMLACMEIFFGDFAMLKPMFYRVKWAGYIFNYFYTALMIIILGNMFIAIIGTNYSDTTNELDAQEAAKIGRPKKHWLLQIYDNLKRQKQKLLACFSKDQRTIEQYRKEEEYLANMHEQQSSIKIFKTPEYSDFIKNQNQTDQQFMTDKQIKKAKQQQRIQSGRSMMRALTMVVFAFLFVFTTGWQLEVTQRFRNFDCLDKNVQKPVFTVDPDQNIEHVDSFQEFWLWMTTSFVTAIVKEHDDGLQYIQNKNYLIGQHLDQGPFRMTFRRVKQVDNETNFDIYEPKIRKNPFIDAQFFNDADDTDDFVGQFSGRKYEYQDKGGYNLQGGYVIYFSSKEELYRQQLDEFKFDEILDKRLNSVVIDYVTYNGSQQIINFASLMFTFNPGGSTKVVPQFRPVRGSLYDTPFDIFRGFCEWLVVVGLFFMGANNLQYIYQEYLNYNNWWSSIKATLSQEEEKERKRLCPEWVRRINAIIDVYVILDMVFLALNIFQVISWVRLITQSRLVLTVSDTEYFEKLNKLVMHYEDYQVVSAVCNVVVMLKLLKYLQINVYMARLVKTINQAKNSIFYYLVVLVILLMGFFLFTYAAFGSNVEKFSTLFLGIMTLMEMFIGVFDYKELRAGDRILAPFFFIIYMLLFAFILLNIFIALLEDAYSKVQAMKTEADEPDKGCIRSIIEWCVYKCKKRSFKKVLEDNVEEAKWVPFSNDPLPVLKNARLFGRSRAEEIVNEQKRRADYKKYILANLGNIDANGSKKTKYKEKFLINRAWLHYWLYMNSVATDVRTNLNDLKNDIENCVKEAHRLQEDHEKADENVFEIFLEIKNTENANVYVEDEIFKLREKIKIFEDYITFGLHIENPEDNSV